MTDAPRSPVNLPAMSFRPNPPWAELIQLVPSIVLAFSFIVGGEVDLAAAGPLFAAAALLAVPISVLVVVRGYALNPILVGAALWLWVGAVAFQWPVPAVAAWLSESQATGLFVAAGLVGVVATVASRGGYVGVRHPDHTWVRRSSLVLLAVTAFAILWAWEYRTNVRLGGGVPFIVVNVVRRVLVARAPRVT